MAFGPVRKKAWDLWKQFGLQEVKAYEEGLFFFKFNSKEGFNKVLRSGSWKMLNKLIHLKEWMIEFDSNTEKYKMAGVWVKLFGLPTNS